MPKHSPELIRGFRDIARGVDHALEAHGNKAGGKHTTKAQSRGLDFIDDLVELTHLPRVALDAQPNEYVANTGHVTSGWPCS